MYHAGKVFTGNPGRPRYSISEEQREFLVHKRFSTTKIATAKIRTLDLRSDISLLACKEGYHLEIRFRILKVRVSRLVSMYVILL